MIWEYKTSRLSQQLNFLVWRPVPSTPQACVYASASTVVSCSRGPRYVWSFCFWGLALRPARCRHWGRSVKWMNEQQQKSHPTWRSLPSLLQLPSDAPSGLLIMDGNGGSETEADVGIITPCVCMIISRLLKMDKAAIIGLQPTRNLRGSRWSIWAFSVL